MWTLLKLAGSAGLGFLGPFGMLLRPPLIYVLILVATHGAVWVKATWVANEHCQTAELKAEIARLKLEAETQKAADEQEAIDTAVLLADKERREKEDADLIEKLRKRPDKCLLGDDAGRI